MKIVKSFYGYTIVLEFKKIKDYTGYSLYQVYKNSKPIYRTCLTDI